MPREDLQPGDTIASYRVIRKLGEGGMGAVYETIQEFTQRRAALKLLHSFRADADYKARFMQEARALAQQDHPNVVRLIDANVTPEGDIWIAMEYLEGCTLRELSVRTGPMPVEIGLHHLIEICDGVSAGHELGIVHCDLKPENVFITKQGATKVVDFGAARAPSLGVIRSTAAIVAAGGKRSVIGTPEYMSPEHLQSQGARERTDVYAIGTMGWEMLAGRHWMAKADGTKPHIWEVVRLQIEVMPPLVSAVAPHVPEYVALLVQRAMEKDQALRWPRVADLAEALRDALARYRAENPESPGDASPKKKWVGPGAWRAHSPPVSLPMPSPPVVDPSSRVLVQVPAEAAVPAPAAVAVTPPMVPAAVPIPAVAGALAVAVAPVLPAKTEELPPRAPEPSRPPMEPPRAPEPSRPPMEPPRVREPAHLTTVPTPPRPVERSPRMQPLRVVAMGFLTGCVLVAVGLVVWLARRGEPAAAESAPSVIAAGTTSGDVTTSAAPADEPPEDAGAAPSSDDAGAPQPADAGAPADAGTSSAQHGSSGSTAGSRPSGGASRPTNSGASHATGTATGPTGKPLNLPFGPK